MKAEALSVLFGKVEVKDQLLFGVVIGVGCGFGELVEIVLSLISCGSLDFMELVLSMM